MTGMVMPHSRAEWAGADNVPAAALAAGKAISRPRSRMYSTICSATLWATSGAAAVVVQPVVPICATTLASPSKMRSRGCKNRSTCQRQSPAIPVAEPVPKAAQNRLLAPPVQAWVRFARSRVSLLLNAPAPPVRVWARSSRIRANLVVVPDVLKKTVPCR